MVKIVRNKKLFFKETGESIVIKSFIRYDGDGTTKIYYYKGFGVNQIDLDITLDDSELEKWINSLSEKDDDKSHVKQQIKKEITMGESNDLAKKDANIPVIQDGNKTINDILIEGIKGVRDGSLTIEKAKAMSQMSQVLINSLKLQLEIVKLNKNIENEESKK